MDYPLNPTDHILLATHESLRERGYCGLSVMLIADLVGPLAPEALRTACLALGRRYPALSAHIRLTSVLKRAFWHIDDDADFDRAVMFEHHRCDEPTQADAVLRRVLNKPINPMHGPQIRLVHVELPDQHHRLGLCWPHPLMDLEGGHALLGALHLILCAESVTLSTAPASAAKHPFPCSPLRAAARVWRGRARHAYYDLFQQPRIVGKPQKQDKVANFLLRRYDATFRSRFEAAAKKNLKPGPLLYTRAMLIGIAQTYLAMAEERGRPRSHFLFSQALRLPRANLRPDMHGNYVTIPWIIFARDDLADRRKADGVALDQFIKYERLKRDAATWEMLRAKQRWPFAIAKLIATHRIPRGAAACTSYRFDDSVTHLGETRVENLAAVGPVNCHPGWIVANSTYRDTMSIAVTFFEDYVDTPSMSEFLDRLEAALLGG